MNLKFHAAVFTDHLATRIERFVPNRFRGGLMADLCRAFDRSAGELEFMRSIDLFQRKLYASLLAKYREEAFCRLLTLKICNLAVSKYHFVHRHSILMSRPFQLTVDPTNVCQLGCPGCVHTTNREYSALFDWPGSTLPLHVYESFLDENGPAAFCAVLYNYGEPLLHKRFADFVRSSKRYLLFTVTSTNLSMPLEDPDDLVASGLDRMILSIDGTTQDVYGIYRRKGRLDLVLENVRKLVAAKKKVGSPTPYLVWQFLTFEHNAHQAKDALRKARELGVNEITIETPYSVHHDDPRIKPVTVQERGSYPLVPWNGRWCSPDHRRAVTDAAARIHAMFDDSWERRFLETPGAEEDVTSGAPTCRWLYQNVTIDGAARILPCCMAPDTDYKHLVFANFGTGTDEVRPDIVNSPMATLARLAFANRAVYQERATHLRPGQLPFCANCTESPVFYSLNSVANDIRALDEKSAVPRPVRWALTNWDSREGRGV